MEAAELFTSLRYRVKNFFRMEDSSRDVGVDAGVGVGGVLERDSLRERNMGC